jgi:hypothetical protein
VVTSPADEPLLPDLGAGVVVEVEVAALVQVPAPVVVLPLLPLRPAPVEMALANVRTSAHLNHLLALAGTMVCACLATADQTPPW